MDIKLEAGAKLPGEELLVALLGFAQKTRETMDPAVRARWDAAVFSQYRDWNNFWVDVLKWPGTRID